MKRLIFYFSLIIISSKSFAKSDFMVDNLCYRVLSITERTVEVTQDEENILQQQQVIEVPDSVEYAGRYFKVVAIGNSAFADFVELCRITLPKTVIQISDNAFRNCCNLDSVLINGPVESIGNYAFYFCSKLKNISLPLSLTQLGYCAFECSGLQAIVIPPNLTKLREYCFGGCMSLKEIYFSDSGNELDVSASCFIGMNQISPIEYAYYGRMVYMNDHVISWRKGYAPITTLIKATIGPNMRWAHYLFRDCLNLEEVEIPNTFSRIGYYLFANCPKLKKLHLPDSLKKIDNYAFMGTDLKNIVLPENVTEIGFKAFYNSNIETIVLPESLESIGENCFNECGNLNKIAVKTPIPIEITENVFSAHSYLFGTLFVPAGKKELYMKAKYWSEFQNISEGNIKYYLIYNVDGKEYKNYALEAGEEIMPETPPTKEGYTFTGWSEIPETMPANNVTVTGKFTINKYTITYMINGAVYMTEEVKYKSAITPPNAPAKEGYSFAWADVPETMPAHDITINGSYTTGIDGILWNEDEKQVFTPDGKRIETPQKGLNIIRMSDGTTKKVMVK
ncbi:MAG: leucine-rich repeat protein [Prevotella sp.]|nr:leucine-rich repeat protein [Prevotella sp.]MBQ6728672.1 leucine-rich repeat protein [Bacteroidales bacterium]